MHSRAELSVPGAFTLDIYTAEWLLRSEVTSSMLDIRF